MEWKFGTKSTTALSLFARHGGTCVLFVMRATQVEEHKWKHTSTVEMRSSFHCIKQLPANTVCILPPFLCIVLLLIHFWSWPSSMRAASSESVILLGGQSSLLLFLFFFLTKYQWPDSRSSHSQSKTGSCRGRDAWCRMNSASHLLEHKASQRWKEFRSSSRTFWNDALFIFALCQVTLITMPTLCMSVWGLGQ